MDPLTVDKGKEKATDDGFFMERLEMLYQQHLGDLRAFAEREGRPYDEVCTYKADVMNQGPGSLDRLMQVKMRMAELHCQPLFAGPSTDPSIVEQKEPGTSNQHRCVSSRS